MVRTDNYDTTFLASNQNPPEHGYFQGYCFHGADFIYGTHGAKHYRALTGRNIPPALDGCYVTVNCHNGAYVFDTDFAGYKVLYYYHDGDTWVVSNSFAQTVEYLRHQNLPIRPNYAHLAAMGGRGMASGQLFSFETLAYGIRVAPRTHSLVITDHKASLQRRSNLATKRQTYASALSDYLNTWVSRFETLMLSDETDFTVDLTGGVDSRANFALVQAAQRRLGVSGTPPRLNCGSTPENRIDLEIAETVAGHYGLKVNDKRTMRRIPLYGDESYQVYRNLTMGVYYPLYMPSRAPTPADITIGGGGGGVHRKIYELHNKGRDLEKFIRRYSKYFKRPEYEAEFVRDGYDFLTIALEKGEDPFRVLLRDGRVRYHSGNAPRTGVSFTPLHSEAADRTQLLAGAERIDEGQFNYDIMHSLDPELVVMPYDTEDKLPTSKILKRLTSTPLPSEANPGTVWAPTAHIIPKKTSREPRIAAYEKAFEAAMHEPFVTKFWDKAMVDKASKLMSTLSAGKRIGNAANGKPIAAMLSTHLVTPNRTQF